MKKYLFTFIALLLITMCAHAQEVATDTLALAVTGMEAEPDPNNQEYIFSIFGTVGTNSYKIQIDYHSASMYGTFTDADFDLEGDGKNHNFIRDAKSDFKFWQFKHLDVVVSDQQGATVVEINGMINDWGDWRRVLATGIIEAPAPKDTLEIDLGLASAIPMDYFGFEYIRLDAANSEYSLAFGVNGLSQLQAGTYYRADMLRPDLVRLPADTLEVADATLVITDAEDGYHNLALSLRATNDTLYQISMHTGQVVATDTLAIHCTMGQMQNLEEMYGMYQFAGVSADYQVALAVTPGVIKQSLRTFTNDSVNLRYTQILDIAAGALIPVQHASGSFELDSTSSFFTKVIVHADLLGVNGTLYQVTLPVGGSQLPTAVDTTVIECEDYVGRLDYTHGPGWLGLVLGNVQADVHVTVYTGLSMSGTFSSDMFIYDDPISYVTIYNDPTVDARFSNVQAAEMRMDSIGDTVRIELNVVTETSHMYTFHARLLPTRALSGEEVEYVINTPLVDDGMMVAFRMDKTGNEQTFYLQLQRADEWDEDGEMTNADNEVWSFVFMQDSVDGISGTYGYSAGTLMEDQYHMLREHNTEIWLMPMAGTLTIQAGAEVRIPAEALGFEYRTHLYSVDAHMAMENGLVYHVTGQNFLLCVDYETEQYLEFTERELTAINDVLAPEGLRVKKVLRDGMLLLESTTHTFTPAGQMLR